MPDFSTRPIVNAMTVDVEDYFQVSAFASVVSRDRWPDYENRVAANTDRLLALFAEHGVHATFFVLGWVADREPLLVRRIAAAGHEIASHGYSHSLVYEQTRAEFRDDVRRSKATLETVCGRPVLGYRAPSFSITNKSLWALDVLVEEGFAWDASIFPIRHDRYGIPSAPRHPHLVRNGLFEIPASTARVVGVNLPVGGGGYFRLLPYAWTRWGIRRVNAAERKPVVFYLHPWEIDPEQPRLAAPWLSRFRHYRNLRRTETRLRQLLSEFRFDSVASAIAVPAADAAGTVHGQQGCKAGAT
jgi:polysaccharide deacetylase family protein (PEP-CTERM system associated)